MLKDNELIGKYIKYSPEISEEIFDKIIKRLKEANFNTYGLNCDFKGFKEYGNLKLYSDYFFQTCSYPEGTEISYKDIIGEEKLQLKDLVEGEIYFYTFKGYCNHISMYNGKYTSKYDLSFNHVNGGKPKFSINTTWNSSATDGTLIKDSLRLATPEEKQWLNVCIAENKFIEKDYALRGYDMYGKAYATQLKKKEMKFEVGKWYKYKFRLSDVDDIEMFYLRSSKTISGNTIYYDEFIDTIGLPHHQKSSSSYANQYVTDEEVSLEEIQSYLPDGHSDKIVKEWWKDLKKGDYVVCIDDSYQGCCANKNYIYQNYENGGVWYGNSITSIGSVLQINYNSFRLATTEEIKMYEHAGNPVDITKYKIPEVMKEEYKVGDWVLTSNNANGWGSLSKDIDNKILRITKINLDDNPGWSGIYYFDKERTVGAKIVRKATPEEIYAVGGYPEQKEEPKKDDTEDLLEEAKRRYPVGTKFKDLVNGLTFTVKSHLFDTFGDKNQLYIPVLPLKGVSNKTARIYKDGVWATIVSSPQEKPFSNTTEDNFEWDIIIPNDIQVKSEQRYRVGIYPYYSLKKPELILKDENEPVIFPNIKKERIVEIKIKLVD